MQGGARSVRSRRAHAFQPGGGINIVRPLSYSALVSVLFKALMCQARLQR